MSVTKTNEALVEQVRQLKAPEDYFKGIDRRDLLLPREVLCFGRMRQTHDVDGWEGISTKSGRYDQHSRFVLLVALNGSGSVGVETDVWELQEGDAILMFPHQVHYYMELPDEFCWLFVTFELERDRWGWLEELRDQPRRLTDAGKDRLGKLLDLFRVSEDGEAALGVSVALGKTLAEMRTGEKLEPGVGKGGLVARVREFVFQHLDGDLSVNAIAAEVDCSGSYLRERFRDEAGVSLGHFVRSVRLLRATHLLQEGNDGVGEIAKKCGFGSFTTFSRAFSQVYGMSPSEYRKGNRSQTV